MAHVLLAEDEGILRMCLKEVIEDAGHTVDDVSNGREALHSLEERHYDALVSDNRMPELTGLELLAILRGKGNKIPFFLHTGDISDELRSKVRTLGATIVEKGGGLFPVQKIHEILSSFHRSAA